MWSLTLSQVYSKRIHNLKFYFAGSYCGTVGLSVVTGPCTAGYYCTLSATRPDPQNDATGGDCPVGHYCPDGTGVPETCPPGYFSNATGNTDFTGCKLCTEGMFTYIVL